MGLKSFLKRFTTGDRVNSMLAKDNQNLLNEINEPHPGMQKIGPFTKLEDKMH
ncbi:hypothetical protein JOC36_001506 [Weissella uvarum]|uniref:hypothetical protein n=1 Tax=Weissella uvarum TaxID=1479233 RepID=UPI001961385B|nr:hypothetical protein [Weissella uvarum]MBM7617913.1 hypothetical protein [Weissella uvarum]MCM0596090.1 hypothetical protein [Weissella uvarum]